MKFAATHKVLTFLLALVSVVPVLISGEVGQVFIGLFVVMFVGGWFMEPPLTRRREFRRSLTITVIGLFLVQASRFLLGMPMAGLGIEFAVMLLGIKLCSRGFGSDYQQISILSFLHVIAGTILLDDLSYAVAFILFVLLSPMVLALGHLRFEIENRFAGDESEDSNRMLSKLLSSRRIVSPTFLLSTGFLSLPIMLMTALLFVTFPRIGLGLLGRLPRSESLAGFSDEVEIGDIDISRRENTVMFRLEPLEQPKRAPARLSLKLRGAVFDVFEDNVWKRSGATDWKRLPRSGHVHWLAEETTLKRERGFEVFLESFEPSVLFIPTGTGAIETEPVGERGRFKPRRLDYNHLGLIRYNDSNRNGIRYKIYLTDAAPWGVPPTPEHDYLQLPADSERLISLAREFAGTGSEKERVRNLVRGLRDNYKYSTRISADPQNLLARTPLDRFLFTRKSGTCEHFATALTLMSRAEGIPARVATGFSGAVWNPVGKYYAVQKRSAHSWTEIYLDDRWVTVDATPAAERSGAVSPFSRLAMIIDAVEMRWRKHIIGYDASSQMELALGVRGMWRSGLKSRLASLRPPRWIWVIPVGLAVIFGVWRWGRRRHTLVKGSGGRRRRLRLDEVQVVGLYRKLDKKLTALGVPRPPARTPVEHLETVSRARPDFIETAREVTERYAAIRFGGEALQAGELERLRSRIRKMA